VLGGVGLFLGVFSRLGVFEKAFLYLFTVFSFFTIFPGLRFYGHYWLQVIPCLSLMVGLGIFSIKQLPVSKIKNKKINYIALGVFLIGIITVFLKEKAYYFYPDYTRILREVYLLNPFPEAKVVGDFIKGRTNKEDFIALIGSEPQIYYYADRKAPSRHAYFSFLVKGTPKSQIMQREFIDDVEKNKPKFLVLFDHSLSLFVQLSADLTVFQWVQEFAREHYSLVGIADIVTSEKTIYIWNKEVFDYKQEGKIEILIYERNLKK